MANRIVGLDLLRSCAILFVIAGHFSMNTGFQETTFEGPTMFIHGMLRSFFGMGVPLFIMLTGYLNSGKEVSTRYYKSSIRVLASYLIFSVITILFRKYYLGDVDSWGYWVHQVLSYSAIPYGWYIEMWIGLFLLTPFLNILYRNIPTQEQKLLLQGILFLMTSVPDLTNRYGMHLTPDFWATCYPLFFYFAGSFIREYQPRVSKIWGGVAILGFCLINPLFNLLFVKDHSMIHITGGPWGVFGTAIAVLFFLMCYQWNTEAAGIRKILVSISKLSLDMYLCCYIFDALLYPIFQNWLRWNTAREAGIYFPIIVPALFLCSYTIAWLKKKIFRF